MNTTEPQIPIENDGTAIEKVQSGQRMVIFAILGNLLLCSLYGLALLLRGEIIIGLFMLLIVVGSLITGIIGVFRLASGLGYGLLIRILFILFLFVGLINVLILLRLNSKATARLRSAGYKVGLLGATKKQA